RVDSWMKHLHEPAVIAQAHPNARSHRGDGIGADDLRDSVERAAFDDDVLIAFRAARDVTGDDVERELRLDDALVEARSSVDDLHVGVPGTLHVGARFE